MLFTPESGIDADATRLAGVRESFTIRTAPGGDVKENARID